MLNPLTLIRDTMLAGALLVLVAVPFGSALGVAVGVVVALLNLTLLVGFVSRMTLGNREALLAAKQLAGVALLFGALFYVPAGPVIVGFCAPMAAVAARAFWSLLRPSSLLPERG